MLRRHLALAVMVLSQAPLTLPAAAVGDKALERVRGVVRAEAAATISSELIAAIKRLPFKAGQSFRKGDILVAFDCRRYEADLRAKRAEQRAYKITVDQNRHLVRHRAGGANDLAIAEARLAQATAAVEALEVQVSQCLIKAPYGGRLVERLVDVYERPKANAPLLKIVKDGRLELDLIVPSDWMTWLKPAQKFSFVIDETKSVHSAEILYLGAVIDPISRTMRLSARLLAPAANVRPGMSGTATFSRR